MTEATKTTKPATGKSAASARISPKLIENVTVEVEAFLGSARMSVAELTALKPGAVVELNAQLNAAVELRLNGVAVAHGELVAVGDNFGVKLTGIAQWPD